MIVSKNTEDCSQFERFPISEERSLLDESNTIKAEANKLYGAAHYDEAIQTYDRALASCPSYLEYEIAVLRSNLAACQLQLEEWKAAIEATSRALEALDRLDPPAKQKTHKDDISKGNQKHNTLCAEGESFSKNRKEAATSGDALVEEISDDVAEKIEALQNSGHTRDEVQKLRTKILLRRVRAYMETGGWASLQSAEEDCKRLATMPNLTPHDRKTVDRALHEIPPRLATAKQKEMSEMMGKLKELGNGILKPFGLSTDNFNFIKDEKSGGYNMQFNQGNSNKSQT